MLLRSGLVALLLSGQGLLASTLEVTVRRADGAPAAGAIVCVGTAQDLAQHGRATADAQGRVSFRTSAPLPHLVTASLSGRGVQQQRTGPPALGGQVPPLEALRLSLPSSSGGPSCPVTGGTGGGLVPRETIARFTPPPVPTRVFIQPRRTEFCFGALGMACGQPQGLLPQSALCSGGSCFINGGSWDHDECCFANPRGMACQAGPLDALTGHDGNCVTAWDKALRLTGKGLFWRRNIDFSSGNSTGRVEFNLYCAPRNTLVPPEDGRRCCSGRTRALTPTEAVASVASRESLVACQ